MRAASLTFHTIYDVKFLCADIYYKNEHISLFAFRRRVNNIFSEAILMFFLHQNAQLINRHDFCISISFLLSNFREQTICSHV